MTDAAIPVMEYWSVFGTAILPILELKAAIPLGFAHGIPIWTTFLLAYLGSSLPCPFIIFFIERVIHWMARSKVKFFNKFANWLLGKVEKHKGKIEKYGYLGVFIFVAIPLPGTGVYTGSLLAAMMNLQPKKSIPLVLLGNLVAGLLMMVFSSFFWPELAIWA
ncbi:small multi-drug export protein [Christensenellaceae bacterium OttesenSCG-928-K19]|nr:small multi-drug export protein [Christensenellaceae bacterium OttesenSCG-928-K19]